MVNARPDARGLSSRERLYYLAIWSTTTPKRPTQGNRYRRAVRLASTRHTSRNSGRDVSKRRAYRLRKPNRDQTRRRCLQPVRASTRRLCQAWRDHSGRPADRICRTHGRHPGGSISTDRRGSFTFRDANRLAANFEVCRQSRSRKSVSRRVPRPRNRAAAFIYNFIYANREKRRAYRSIFCSYRGSMVNVKEKGLGSRTT